MTVNFLCVEVKVEILEIHNSVEEYDILFKLERRIQNLTIEMEKIYLFNKEIRTEENLKFGRGPSSFIKIEC